MRADRETRRTAGVRPACRMTARWAPPWVRDPLSVAHLPIGAPYASFSRAHAENHSLPFAYRAARPGADLAALGWPSGRERLRTAPGPRIRGRAERRRAVRRLAAQEVRDSRPARRATPRPHGDARRHQVRRRPSGLHSLVRRAW